MLKVMLDLGGEATCKEIGEKLEKKQVELETRLKQKR